MKKSKAVSLSLSLALFAAACTWTGDVLSQTKGKSNFTLPAAKSDSPLDPKKLGDPLPANTFIELSKLLNPTVVSIFTSQSVQRPGRGGRGFQRDPMEDLFEQFFGFPGGPGGGMQAPPPRQATGLGTGFIVRDDGLILTNNHVVQQADVIKVQLDNNSDKFFEATVLGRDARTDIALIKIDAKRTLPVAQLGSSKDVQVGEFVAAFGNPYGHAHTMTKGIVSAIGRAIPELNRFPFIQTDASINPGNSGGPLVNLKGLVIGVNTAIDARAQGIGFAIPIDDVKRIVSQLEKDGRIRRGFLGVGLASVTPDIAEQLGLEQSADPTAEGYGVIISKIVEGGPADKAGLKPYDVVLEFNGRKVANPADLSNAVADTEVGRKVPVKVLRFENENKKKTLGLEVTIAENPEDSGRALGKMVGPNEEDAPKGGKVAPNDLGFRVMDETSALRKKYEVADEVRGPIIVDVDPRGPAARKGLRPGDVVLDVNRVAVSKATDVTKALGKGRNLIRVARGSMIVIVVL